MSSPTAITRIVVGAPFSSPGQVPSEEQLIQQLLQQQQQLLQISITLNQKVDALAQQIEELQMSLKNQPQIDQVDATVITGAGTTQAAPLPVLPSSKNKETYKRTLTANLTDYAYATTAPGRKVEQGFLNDAASGAYLYTINAQPGDTFNAPDLVAATSFTLQNGEARTFVNTANGVWDQLA